MEMKNTLEQLELLLEERNFRELRDILTDLNSYDIAAILGQFDAKQMLVLFRLLPKEAAAEVFVEMDSEVQESLIASFSDHELKEILDELYVDDTVDIIEEMPANVVKRIIRNTDPQTRASINEILNYPKDSAGSIMTIEYIRLDRTMTVTDAFKRIKRVGLDKETIYNCYVTEHDKTLIGIVTVRTLLLAEEEAFVGDIMKTNVMSVNTDDDKEFVAREMSKYGYLAMPVVDSENRLVGIVTVDDAIDVLQDETTEDIQKMAAITPTDKTYFKTGIFETWRKRIPWLLLLMVTATFTGMIISYFEDALSKVIVLVAFIPMLMDTGGNAGGQTSVTIIRGLSLGEVEMGDVFRVLWKEIRVAVLCGITVAVVCFAKVLFIDRVEDYLVAVVVSLTLFIAIVVAKTTGCILPILAKRLGFDPAVMASPFITTIVDIIALIVYFMIATAILPQLG